MPLPAPYQGSCRVPSPFVGLFATGLGQWMRALGLTWLGLVACERDYPLEPTYCDHWCHTFDQAGCVVEPADCVRECEETKGPPACEEVRQTLLGCYQNTPAEKFECSSWGGLASVRIEDGACQSERDALYECAVPGISQCLSTCRVLQTELDPALLVNCPIAGNSCEEICWILTYSAPNVPEAGVSVSGDTNPLVLQLGLLCASGDAGLIPPIPL